MTSQTHEIVTLAPEDLESSALDLADILCSTVHAGASVGFVLPFDTPDSLAFWRTRVFPTVQTGHTTLFVIRCNQRIVGTVQLGHGMMPNQTHRADVAKLLVHPDHRRLGYARALMAALENHARRLGKKLLVLDTRSGDSAQILYRNLGYVAAGEIPNYCQSPDDRMFEATTFMYKALT